MNWTTARSWTARHQTLGAFEPTGYKLLKRYPSAATTGAPDAEGYYSPGQQVKALEGNAVPFGATGPWRLPRRPANFCADLLGRVRVQPERRDRCGADVDRPGHPRAGVRLRTRPPVRGAYRYPYVNTKFALSYWCADCHNLNLGGWEPLSDPELGFKAHTERTHPAPFYGAYSGPGQCYSCHRNDMPAMMGPPASANPASVSFGSRNSGAGSSRNSCTQCHYGTADYAVVMGNMGPGSTPTNYTLPDLGFDFPHSGRRPTSSCWVRTPSAFPPAASPPATSRTAMAASAGSTNLRPATISENNLDAVCLRCHPGVGVHQ